MRTPRKRHSGFSLIELVIVIIIMGVISAIAIPRMVRGAEGADVTGLQADLAVLRGAIEMYRYEHSAFPTALNFGDQLTKETDQAGTPAPGGGYGPYLVKLPALKTGIRKGQKGVAVTADNPPLAPDPGATVGWIYNETIGSIWANDVDHLDK